MCHLIAILDKLNGFLRNLRDISIFSVKLRVSDDMGQDCSSCGLRLAGGF